MVEINGLDREDLTTLVLGSSPTLELTNNEFLLDSGVMNDYGDVRIWTWDTDKLHDKSDEELYEIYLLCKSHNKYESL